MSTKVQIPTPKKNTKVQKLTPEELRTKVQTLTAEKVRGRIAKNMSWRNEKGAGGLENN